MKAHDEIANFVRASSTVLAALIAYLFAMGETRLPQAAIKVMAF